MQASLLQGLAGIVGAEHVLVDPDARAAYESDASGRAQGRSLAVVLPGSSAEVAATLRLCAEKSVPVIARGGGSGLVGGAVPRGGELVLSLARLREIEAVEESSRQLRAGAGATLEQLQGQAAGAGLELALDFAARGSATLGGMIATNAGGHLAMRHGSMRAQVTGLEAVLIDGTVISRMSGLLKDNAGYNLPELLIGSEGTLAVITAGRVRLIARRAHKLAALFGLESLEQAQRLLDSIATGVESLRAADFFERPGLELVLAQRSAADPFPRAFPAYLLVECAADLDPLEPLERAVESSGLEPGAAVADDSAGRAALWALREGHNEAVLRAGVPLKLDVSVPVGGVAAFVAAVHRRVAELAPAARTIAFGHLGDGNVHLNVLGPDPEDEALTLALLELVGRHGGSVSAEHGIGAAKVRYLGITRSAAEIEVMRRIKLALDPGWLLNPGCVLPAPAAQAARGDRQT